MNIELLSPQPRIAHITSPEPVITDVGTALDLMMTVRYQWDTDLIAIEKSALVPAFFILSTGLAGEVLQKFINYKMKLAIYGDFSKYTSKPLQDFIFESNQGTDICFVDSLEQAVIFLKKLD